jgi:AHBA synthesis associated protein
MPSPSALLFDLDGVLIFSEDAWFAVYQDARARFGHPPLPRSAFEEIYGQGTRADRDRHFPNATVEELDAFYARAFPARLDRVRANLQAAPALEVLRGHIPLAVATNTNLPLARRLLEHAGLLALFDVVASASEVGAGKPDPAVLRHAARRLGIEVEDCWMIGDSVYDRDAAAAAPCRFVGFRCEGDLRVENLGELSGLLRAASGSVAP